MAFPSHIPLPRRRFRLILTTDSIWASPPRVIAVVATTAAPATRDVTMTEKMRVQVADEIPEEETGKMEEGMIRETTTSTADYLHCHLLTDMDPWCLLCRNSSTATASTDQ